MKLYEYLKSNKQLLINLNNVGYKEDEATSIYQMIYSIKPGDIIYIKSFYKQTLNIKAIGIVLPEKERFKQNYVQGLGYGVKVKWLKTILNNL